MNVSIRMHLVNGEVVDGASEEGTQEDLERAKDGTSRLLISSKDTGWQINIELPNGNWAIFPRSSVLYVEYVIS